MQKMVAYYRVSTKRQGQSGLGLEAQQAAARAFAEQAGGQIIREFIEVETGKFASRPQLDAAIPFAKRAKATLIVAKLDRLARNAEFLLSLQNSGVDFQCCDNPHANKMTIGILAVVAEYEREQIAARTKASLQAAKARGVKLGSARPGHWEGREEARRRGAVAGSARAAVVIRSKAQAAYKDLRPAVLEMRERGLSLAKIADALNNEGHRTRRDCLFTPVQVSLIISRPTK